MDQWFCLSLRHNLVKPEQWLQMKFNTDYHQEQKTKYTHIFNYIKTQEHHNQQIETLQGLIITVQISEPLMFGKLVYIALTPIIKTTNDQ